MDALNTSQLCFYGRDSFRQESQSEFDHKLSESGAKIFIPSSNSNHYDYDPIGAEIIFEDKNSKNCKNSFTPENIILELFKKDHLMDFEEKINLSRIVLSYFTNFRFFEEFFEEECHLAMVNWVYKLKNILANEIESETRSQFYVLLNIILNIFEILPIKVDELFSLNIYEKLNKFRKIMKNKNFIIYQKLDRLLCYWSQFLIDGFYLNKKRERIEKENEEMKEVECQNKKKAFNFENINLHQNLDQKKDYTVIDYIQSNNNNNMQNIRNHYDKSSVYDTGVLKLYTKNKSKKSVQWKTEDEINQINIFKYYDPPASGAISPEEYESINSFINDVRNKNSS